MTALEDSRTYLPPADLTPMEALFALKLHEAGALGAHLVLANGTEVVIPPVMLHLVADAAEIFAHGRTVEVAAYDEVLSTTQAAALLGVSRPTVVHLLESGQIPYEQPGGTHRRVRLADVQEYQRRQAFFADFTREGQEMGLDDVDMDEVVATVKQVRREMREERGGATP